MKEGRSTMKRWQRKRMIDMSGSDKKKEPEEPRPQQRKLLVTR
jgi:hypothetical protein